MRRHASRPQSAIVFALCFRGHGTEGVELGNRDWMSRPKTMIIADALLLTIDRDMNNFSWIEV